MGCYERTLALLIEKYAGAFPLWLAPEQVRVLPISERLHDAAQAVTDRLTAAGLRVEIDRRNEKIGYKIREAQVQRCPICWSSVTGRPRREPYRYAPGEKETSAPCRWRISWPVPCAR